jgi:hypothetical protein
VTATITVLDPCYFWGRQQSFVAGGPEETIRVVSTMENPVRCIDKPARREQVPRIDVWAIPDFFAEVFTVSPLPSLAEWASFEPDRQRLRTPLDSDTDDVLFLGSISNCEVGRSPRLALASRMKRYAGQHNVSVVVSGACFRSRDPISLGDQLKKKQRHMTKAAFALAFENSFSPAYATEKVFDAIVAGAVPVVLGGSRYSDMLPRRAGDADGSHPVFIDATSFASPEELVGYLLWLVKTGKLANYRPWIDGSTGRARAAEQVNLTLPHRDSHIQWPCIDADIVRCGFGHLAPPSGWLKAAVEYQGMQALGVPMSRYNIAAWFLHHLQHVESLDGIGDASVSQRIGKTAASQLPAPWRHRNADPTLGEWRLQSGAGPAGVGPGEVLLDLTFCDCKPPEGGDDLLSVSPSPHAWCVATQGMQISHLRGQQRTRWWVGDAMDKMDRISRFAHGIECRYWQELQ